MYYIITHSMQWSWSIWYDNYNDVYILYICIDTMMAMYPRLRCLQQKVLKGWMKKYSSLHYLSSNPFESFRFSSFFPRLPLQYVCYVYYFHDNVFYYRTHSFTSFTIILNRKIKTSTNVCVNLCSPPPARGRVLSVSRPRGLFPGKFWSSV